MTSSRRLVRARAATYLQAGPALGQPRLKGARLADLKTLAATAVWVRTQVYRYGRTQTVDIAMVEAIWYGPFGNTASHLVLQQDPDSTSAYHQALFSTDMDTTGERIVERYAVRWSIEPSNASSMQHTGVGQARNRLPRAVERTVPFGMIVQSMVITWYVLYGYDPADVTDRAIAQPWYRTKAEPSFEDMILKLRKTIIAARFTTVTPGQPGRSSADGGHTIPRNQGLTWANVKCGWRGRVTTGHGRLAGGTPSMVRASGLSGGGGEVVELGWLGQG